MQMSIGAVGPWLTLLLCTYVGSLS